jgi:hypothetical protein
MKLFRAGFDRSISVKERNFSGTFGRAFVIPDIA